MDTFDHLLNWKLKPGSHLFPGPDGGTCINEAALVVTGFAYRPISCAREMPGCFSRPICDLAMTLNDRASDQERQRLLPFVIRLACTDAPEIEAQTETYIVKHTRGYRYGVPFEVGLKALEGVLAIGQQADPFAAEDVKVRMDTARAQAATPTSDHDRPFSSKVESWLTTEEIA